MLFTKIHCYMTPARALFPPSDGTYCSTADPHFPLACVSSGLVFLFEVLIEMIAFDKRTLLCYRFIMFQCHPHLICVTACLYCDVIPYANDAMLGGCL